MQASQTAIETWLSRIRKVVLPTLLGPTIALASASFLLTQSLPRNPLSVSLLVRASSLIAVPEGWAFFTRDARETDVVGYAQEAGEWKQVDGIPYSRTWYSLDRRGRMLSSEIQWVAGFMKTNHAELIRCPMDELDQCLSSAEEYEVAAPSSAFSFCGKIALLLIDPTPWAWASTTRREEKFVRTWRARIICDG